MLLDGAPPGFAVPGLPPGVDLARRPTRPPYDVAVLFCPDAARLARRWPVLHASVTPAGRLWVAWPKKASGVTTDLDDAAVRAYGLVHGRVDVKVCAIDQTWSGLAFVVRVTDR